MKIISCVFSNEKLTDSFDYEVSIPSSIVVNKMNNHQITMVIFLIGCYFQDIIIDQKEKIYNTESNKSFKFGFDDINDRDYDFISDRLKFKQHEVVFNFVTSISNDDIADLLNDINNSFSIVSNLIRTVVKGFFTLFKPYIVKNKVS
jgi:hypothetical protein